MDYNQIKKTIEDDYNKVAQARVVKGGRNSMKTFYLNFSRALEELHKSVGPFICNKEQFIEHIKYLKDVVNKDVYDIILQYCKDNLKLDIN